MLHDTDWRALAQCREDNAIYFFPPSHFERKAEKDLRENAARALCDRCSVRDACLSYAVNVQELHGIWGGLNELQRRRYVRRQQAARTA